MSHISTYKVKIKFIDTFLENCEKHHALVHRLREGSKVRMFGSQHVDNAIAAIKVQGWRYDIALTADGKLKYDHFGAAPKSMENLHAILQDYNEQVVTSQIPFDQVTNYFTTQLENGDRELVLEYGT